MSTRVNATHARQLQGILSNSGYVHLKKEPVFTPILVESYKDDRIMHLAHVHDHIVVALKSGTVRVYDAYSRQYVNDLKDIQQVCSSLVVGELAFFGAMRQAHVLDSKTLKQITAIDTTEWVFALCMLDD